MILRKPNLSNEKITKQIEIVKKKETRSKLQQHSTKQQKTIDRRVKKRYEVQT